MEKAQRWAASPRGPGRALVEDGFSEEPGGWVGFIQGERLMAGRVCGRVGSGGGTKDCLLEEITQVKARARQARCTEQPRGAWAVPCAAWGAVGCRWRV